MTKENWIQLIKWIITILTALLSGLLGGSINNG